MFNFLPELVWGPLVLSLVTGLHGVLVVRQRDIFLVGTYFSSRFSVQRASWRKFRKTAWIPCFNMADGQVY